MKGRSKWRAVEIAAVTFGSLAMTILLAGTARPTLGMMMSVFEMAMLMCFGVSWPFAVFRTYHAKSSKGKSLIFLGLVFVGYGFGCVHKAVYSMDGVIVLYAVNGVLVLTDLALACKYRLAEAAAAKAESGVQERLGGSDALESD